MFHIKGSPFLSQKDSKPTLRVPNLCRLIRTTRNATSWPLHLTKKIKIEGEHPALLSIKPVTHLFIKVIFINTRYSSLQAIYSRLKLQKKNGINTVIRWKLVTQYYCWKQICNASEVYETDIAGVTAPSAITTEVQKRTSIKSSFFSIDEVSRCSLIHKDLLSSTNGTLSWKPDIRVSESSFFFLTERL